MVDSSIPFRPNHDAIVKRSMHSLYKGTSKHTPLLHFYEVGEYGHLDVSLRRNAESPKMRTPQEIGYI